MPLLNTRDAQTVREGLDARLRRPVKLVFATSVVDCPYCEQVQALCRELAALSPNLALEVHDIDDPALAAYELDKTPAIAVVADGWGVQPDADYGIRFYGVPSGYEFMSLLDAIHTVGSGDIRLSPETLAFLQSLEQDVHIQVFVTPTCPHCPGAVVLAHHLAYASPRVTADMVEAMEFPDLSDRYQVYGVPRTVINETVHQEGAAPEALMLQKLRQAVAIPPI